MSFNRLSYDTCEYKKRLDESVGPLAYILNPMKYENCNKCRHELGIVGGSNVSNVEGDLVLLESELHGRTRPASSCPSMLYQPNNGDKIHIAGSACGPSQEISIKKMHLPPCQMIRYKPVPLPPAINPQMCAGDKMSAPQTCEVKLPANKCN
jgi:hypothetical protein